MSGESCFLLGAGFSRAINEAMPTLADLRDAVLQRLDRDVEVLRPFGDDLEQWMSYLSVDQPWLSVEENLRNRAAFGDASSAVAGYIEAAELKARQGPIPIWLKCLIATWFETEATLITFNYDTLIERAASAQRRLGNWGDIYGIPLNIRSSINHGLVMGAAMYTQSIPELFKLHGSTSWGSPGLDSSPTDPVTIIKSSGNWEAESHPPVRARGQSGARYSDLTQLIIPPTGTKGAFYSNRALQAQWKAAFERLESATNLTIIGYSFPPSDLGARHFVANALPPDIPVTIVDYNPEIVTRIEQFLGPDHQMNSFIGADAVREFVDKVCGDLITWGVQRQENGSFAPRLLVNQVPERGPEELLRCTAESFETLSNQLTALVEKRYPGLVTRSLEDWNDGSFYHLPRSAVTTDRFRS